MSYNVYTVEYLGSPNHVGLFVETNTDKSGQIFHVTGNLLTGMTYENKPAKRPEDSASYVPGSQKFVGRIAQSDMENLDELCRSVKPPEAQLHLSGRPRNPSERLRRCGEWVQEVKEKALDEGLIVPCGNQLPA